MLPGDTGRPEKGYRGWTCKSGNIKGAFLTVTQNRSDRSISYCIVPVSPNSRLWCSSQRCQPLGLARPDGSKFHYCVQSPTCKKPSYQDDLLIGQQPNARILTVARVLRVSSSHINHSMSTSVHTYIFIAFTLPSASHPVPLSTGKV
jgi:hypothetical protein